MPKSKGALNKLKTVAQLLRDADADGRIDGTLRHALSQAGLTDIKTDAGWDLLPTPLTPPPEASPIDDCDVKDIASEPDPPALPSPEPEEEIDPKESVESEQTAGKDDNEVQEIETELIREQDSTVDTPASWWGFLWCVGCGRLDIIQCRAGDSRQSPWEPEVDGNGRQDEIMTVRCRTCRAKDRSCVFADRGLIESQYRQALGRLRPWIFGKSEGREAAETVRGRDVQMATKAEGIAYVEVEKIIGRLEEGDLIASVNMAQFQRGVRSGLIHQGLAGGLI